MGEKIKTVNIKGKEYVEVSTRVKHFRSNPSYKGWGLCTEIVELNDKSAILKAVITDQEGRTVATGIAHEIQSSSYINKTSFIENCETSAWGRALGNLGIGIDGGIASYEEVATLEGISKEKALEINTRLKKTNTDMKLFTTWLADTFHTTEINALSMEQANKVLEALKKKEG